MLSIFHLDLWSVLTLDGHQSGFESVFFSPAFTVILTLCAALNVSTSGGEIAASFISN